MAPWLVWLVLLGVATLSTTAAVVSLQSAGGSGASPTSVVPACAGSPPSLSGAGTPVPPGQFRMIYEMMNGQSGPSGGSAAQSRITVWSQSDSTYYIYVMSQADYDALGWTSNASASPSQSTASGPAQSYLWSSGPVTSTNHTVIVGNGNWYVVFYNPGTTVAYINEATGSYTGTSKPPPFAF